MRLAAGVDIGGTDTKLGIVREDGVLMEHWKIPTDRSDGGNHILEAAVRELKAWEARTGGSIDCAGLGIPGPVNRDGWVNACVDLGWRAFEPEKSFRALWDLPVRAGNDANMAALGEAWQGAGRGADSMMMITLGTGVGGSVIIHGKVIVGRNGLAGEIGHIQVNPEETEKCNCGQTGCLDQIASAGGFVREARRRMQAGQKSVLSGIEKLSSKDVFEAAANGDELSRETIERCCTFLGMALARAGLLLDPDLYVLGGGVTAAGSMLLDPVTRAYEKYSVLASQKARVCIAELGNKAGMLGAARYVLQKMNGQIEE